MSFYKNKKKVMIRGGTQICVEGSGFKNPIQKKTEAARNNSYELAIKNMQSQLRIAMQNNNYSQSQIAERRLDGYGYVSSGINF